MAITYDEALQEFKNYAKKNLRIEFFRNPDFDDEWRVNLKVDKNSDFKFIDILAKRKFDDLPSQEELLEFASKSKQQEQILIDLFDKFITEIGLKKESIKWRPNSSMGKGSHGSLDDFVTELSRFGDKNLPHDLN